MAQVKTILSALNVGKKKIREVLNTALDQAEKGEGKIFGFTLSPGESREELISEIKSRIASLGDEYKPSYSVQAPRELTEKEIEVNRIKLAEQKAKEEAERQQIELMRKKLPSVDQKYPFLSEFPQNVQDEVKAQYDDYLRNYPLDARAYKRDIESTIAKASPQVARKYLEDAGYSLAVESPKSESLYFKHPAVGERELLRLSGHSLPENAVMGPRASGFVFSGKQSPRDELKQYLGVEDEGFEKWPSIKSLLPFMIGGGALAAAAPASAAFEQPKGLFDMVASSQEQPTQGILGAVTDPRMDALNQAMMGNQIQNQTPQIDARARLAAALHAKAQEPFWPRVARNIPRAAREVGDFAVDIALPLWATVMAPRDAY